MAEKWTANLKLSRRKKWPVWPSADECCEHCFDGCHSLCALDRLPHVALIEKTMTSIPLHPWERARRRRSLFRSCILGYLFGTALGLAYQAAVCFILK